MVSICLVETNNVCELARLACAFESIQSPIFALMFDELVLALQHEIIDDIIIFYYAKSNEVGQFLAYKHTTKEYVKFTDSGIDPTYTYAPIIFIEKLPEEWKEQKSVKCKKIILKDLNSLSKLCIYKNILYDTPSSLFYFDNLVGMFMSLDNIDTYFYCVRVEEPDGNFLRYNSITSQSIFTNKIEEHGYLYVKLIRLKNRHPLVEA